MKLGRRILRCIGGGDGSTDSVERRDHWVMLARSALLHCTFRTRMVASAASFQVLDDIEPSLGDDVEVGIDDALLSINTFIAGGLLRSSSLTGAMRTCSRTTAGTCSASTVRASSVISARTIRPRLAPGVGNGCVAVRHAVIAEWARLVLADNTDRDHLVTDEQRSDTRRSDQ